MWYFILRVLSNVNKKLKKFLTKVISMFLASASSAFSTSSLTTLDTEVITCVLVINLTVALLRARMGIFVWIVSSSQ